MQTYSHDSRVYLTFSKAEAKALLAFASTDETRTALCSVCLRYVDGRPEAIATDGHTLLLLRGRTGGSTPIPAYSPQGYAVIPRSTMMRAVKACGARESIAIAIGSQVEGSPILHADVATVPHAGRKGEGDPMLGSPSTTSQVVIDGGMQYPPVDQVIPARRTHGTTPDAGAATGSAIWYADPHYLARLADVADAVGATSVRASIADAEWRPDRSWGAAKDQGEWAYLAPMRYDIEGRDGTDALALVMPVRG